MFNSLKNNNREDDLKEENSIVFLETRCQVGGLADPKKMNRTQHRRAGPNMKQPHCSRLRGGLPTEGLTLEKSCIQDYNFTPRRKLKKLAN